MQMEFDQYLSLLTNLEDEIVKKIREQYLEVENNKSETLKWTESQSKLLKSLINTYCSNQNIIHIHVPDKVWNIISKLLNKSIIDCRQQLENTKKLIFHQQWTKTEDDILKQICNQYTFENKQFKWNEIAKELSQKYNKSTIKLTKHVRDRWINKLNPQILKGPWEINEELELIKNILKHGKNWQNIAAEMKNQRTENSIKNRYFNIQKKMEFKEIQQLDKQQIENELLKHNIIQFNKVDELGQQEISFILFYLNELTIKKNKLNAEQFHLFTENAQKKQELQVDLNHSQKKKLKTSQKSDNSHASNILGKVLKQYQQDQSLDQNKIQDHYENLVSQRGKKLELDKELLSNSENLSDVQFGIKNKDSQNVHVFPKTQLKAVMEIIKQKKDSKKETKKESAQLQIKQKMGVDVNQIVNQKQKQTSKQKEQVPPLQIQQQQSIQNLQNQSTCFEQQLNQQQNQFLQQQNQFQQQQQQNLFQQQQQLNQYQQQQQQLNLQQQQQQNFQQLNLYQQQQQQPQYQLLYPNFLNAQMQMPQITQIPVMGQISGQGQGQGQMMNPIPGQQMMIQMPQQMMGQLSSQLQGQMQGQNFQLVSAVPGQMQQIVHPLHQQMGDQLQHIIQNQSSTNQNNQQQNHQMHEQSDQIQMQQVPPIGIPQQYFPFMFPPQSIYPQQQFQQISQQSSLQNTNLKDMFQQSSNSQQMPAMNYAMSMIPQFGDQQYFQLMNMNQGFSLKQPNQSIVKQELENQQHKNNK
ncbi:unnamed protein product [Paramecium sonneborni]|uniref:Myb-like DNA-binding domain protein n=1 Tax=Paramecium sonneborni TaxID=65129 RepID=A0A8S1R982_9CILI|nr:unnamed protein product [Paramecium sonneborni]